MLEIEIRTETPAFVGRTPFECGRILREIATQVESGQVAANIHDQDGKPCGQWYLRPTDMRRRT